MRKTEATSLHQFDHSSPELRVFVGKDGIRLSSDHAQHVIAGEAGPTILLDNWERLHLCYDTPKPCETRREISNQALPVEGKEMNVVLDAQLTQDVQGTNRDPTICRVWQGLTEKQDSWSCHSLLSTFGGRVEGRH